MKSENESNWQYTSDGAQTASEPTNNGLPGTPAAPGNSPPVAWTASEYVEHHHGSGWYIILAVGTISFAAVVFLLTDDYFASIVVVMVGIIVGVYAGKKPREIAYEISASGIKAGDKSYGFREFKSFAVIREGNLNSINLVPLKRFMPPVSAYFAKEDEEQIVSALGEHLPLEERRADRMDRLTSRLRF